MVKSAFLKLFLEAKKKCVTPTGLMYTKVSWLEGNFSVNLPDFSVVWSVLADSPYTTKSSLSQLRASGGFSPHFL
jgi:hypothetical protein